MENRRGVQCIWRIEEGYSVWRIEEGYKVGRPGSSEVTS